MSPFKSHTKILKLFLAVIVFLIVSSVSAANRFSDLRVDITQFLEQGCKRIATHHEEPCCITVPAHLDCSQAELERRFKCSRIEELPGYYGGLRPIVPIVQCVFNGPWDAPANDGIRYIGAGWIPVYNKFIVYAESQFKLLNNPQEFKHFFAPIDSAEEALSFTAALTGSYPLYRIEIPEGYIRESNRISSTFVEETNNGYKVHLFDYDLGGCGPHHYFSVDYLVTKEGDLSKISRQNIWRDPKEDNLCVD